MESNRHSIDSSTEQPLVTVVIPLYNKEEHIRDALESVKAQGYRNMEVFIIDDQSTDDSYRVAEAYLSEIRDDRFTLVRNDSNLGLQGNGNRCLEVGKGKYIIRLDADDKMPVYRVEKQVQLMEDNPEMGASGGYNQLLGSAERVYKMPVEPEKINASFIFQTPISQGTSSIQRKIIEKHDIRYDENGPAIGEDWLFFYKISRVSGIGNLPEVLNEYRHYSGNASRTYNEDYYEDIRSVLKYILHDRGLECNSKEIDLHMMLRYNFTTPCDKRTIRELESWCEKLIAHFKDEPFIVKEVKARRLRAFENMYFQLKLFDYSALFELMKRVRPRMKHMRFRFGAFTRKLKPTKSR